MTADDPTGGLIPGLTFVSNATGMESYLYTDPADGNWIEFWIDNSGTFLFSKADIAGDPEVPIRVMRWLVDRTDYLTKTGGPPFS